MARPPNSLPPQAIMMQMINGKLVSRCVSLVAELAIADHLKDGPREAAALATATDTHPDALYRVLRMLAGLGVFAELPDRRFQNTPLSEVLRSDAPGSVRSYARWLGTDLHWQVVTDLDHSVRTGETAMAKRHPNTPPFEVLAQYPKAQETFNDAMTGLSLADGAAIIQAYDFSQVNRVVDVGGGHGTLAMMMARAAPGATVTVFDLPHVIEGAKKRFAEENPDGRLHAVAGSFLDEVPGPTDLCVLKHIIHDWDDESARRILNNCRAALDEGGRVVVCEMLITPGPESLPARILDIEMLAGPGGRERTEAEFADLFNRAGLTLRRVIETRTPIRLLEAVAER